MPDAGSGQPYRVLARKYRPQTFKSLIGQEAMVRTLGNAIASDRIAHAFILTGVRGVGKTTTARIIARALNCIGADGEGGPTVEPCGQCTNCVAIADDRHVDVLEMDAASRTGVDDVRELIDGVRYLPVQARYKIYIVDEVHMLSRNAFNALLKTLEEPPPHVKFIFATTEIRKVPVTVLSRCQRFDLRRVGLDLLVDHFRSIIEQEQVTAEPAALALIARAAEGSVRDGLSMLDQAIAHSSGDIAAEQVRAMLGLADRNRIVDLFAALMKGDIKDALSELRDQYDAGADPLVILEDLLGFTHSVTRLKVTPAAGEDSSVAEHERELGKSLASALSMPVLSLAWQILLKGMTEARTAPSPIAAVEMVLIRLAYAAELPDPARLIRALKAEPAAAEAEAARAMPTPSGQDSGPRGLLRAVGGTRPERLADPERTPVSRLDSFEAVVALFGERREALLQASLLHDVHLVAYQRGRLEFRLGPNVPKGFVQSVQQKLTEWTGEQWLVTISGDSGAPTLASRRAEEERSLRAEAERDELVQALKQTFPDAEIRGVRRLDQLAPGQDDGSELIDDDLGEDGEL